jgi:hypothetical protein
LLISAVADERNGVEGAVPAILKWATDPNRFPEEWIEAVHRLISQARQCVR